MTDRDQTMIHSLNGSGDGLLGRFEDLGSFTGAEDRPAEFFTGLVSLGFIKAALRRGRRFWSLTAVVGFLLGIGVYVMSPHAYQASTSLLLTPGPYENLNTAANNDQAMAESHAVAGLAVHKLGLRQSAASFLGTYKVVPVTERVITITASAPSGNQAVLDAGAVATAFLQFRADEMRAEQRLVLASLNQQLSQAKQHRGTQTTAKLASLQQAVIGNETVTQPATAAAVRGSVVMDRAALLPHSRLKPLLLYAAIGLIAGLGVSMGIVVIRALVSDRLRQRDDIARALGAPVKLSVGTVRLNRWLPGRGGRHAARDANVRRIAAHLGRTVAGSSQGAATLAVIAVDNPQVAALSLVSLAASSAKDGMQVVLADLASGAPAARLLGSGAPGVSVASAQGARLVVAVPEREDVVPIGPLGHVPARAQRSPFTEAVAAASVPANLLLTLASLDPSLGGDHLATWAAHAVAVITAGRSSWTKINAVGEMVRLSGTHLVSAVLIGADKTDESLGVIDAQCAVSDSGANGFVAAIDEGRGGG